MLIFFPAVTETTGSLSGVSITSELNEELNDLIQRFHNQLRDSQVTIFYGIVEFKITLIETIVLKLD